MSKNWPRTLLAALALLYGGVAAAQDRPDDAPSNSYQPFDVLPSELLEAMPSLNNRVLYFVDFACPFCRHYHEPMNAWSHSLPSRIDFEVIPVVATEGHAKAAIAYYTVVFLAPNRVGEFENILYEQLSTTGGLSPDVGVFLQAAKTLGIDSDAFRRATGTAAVKAYVERARTLTVAYGLEESPALVVGNRFRTAPRLAQNDIATFLKLMNGLVSQIFQGSYGT